MQIPITPDLSPRVRAIRNPESTWARHVIDSVWHFVDTAVAGSVGTRCNGRWSITDDFETKERPPLADRCGACQQSLVDQRIAQLAAPANYDWPSAHELEMGGES